MCGRFVQHSPIETLQQIFKVDTVSCDLTPSYNVAPTQPIPAVVKYKDKKHLEKLYWGLVPFWAKDIKIGSGMINARAETAATKPAFRNAFKKQRCLIVADGFYEWKGEKGRKQPYFITLQSGGPFAFAGLWEAWTDKAGDPESAYKSCTIITASASDSIKALHDRMPVILHPEYHDRWMDAELQDPKALGLILQEGSIRDMKYYPVATYVNSVKNNDPDCLKPISA